MALEKETVKALKIAHFTALFQAAAALLSAAWANAALASTACFLRAELKDVLEPHVVLNRQYKPHMVQLRSRLAVFIRTRRGEVTQRAFARKLGVAQSTIMRIENEQQNVTLETLDQLCKAFQLDIGELFPPLPAKRNYAALSPAAEAPMIHEQPRRTRRKKPK